MTRFARGGSENSKRPLDATPWRDMKGQSSQGHQRHRQSVNDYKHKSSNTKDKGEGEVEKGLMLTLKKETRREDRRVKRINKRSEEKVCYNCRGSGHAMSECPEAKKDIEQGTGICFKCGSTEHASSKCRLKIPAGKFPYAKCFICGEMGHLSKQCPDNPRGLFPMESVSQSYEKQIQTQTSLVEQYDEEHFFRAVLKTPLRADIISVNGSWNTSGGCCKICESVEHYERDCPNRTEQTDEDRKDFLVTWRPGTSVDEEISTLHRPAPPPKKKTGPKLVKF